MEQLILRATAIEPVLHSLTATTTEPARCNYWSPGALESAPPETPSQREARHRDDSVASALQLDQSAQQRRPAQPKINK